MPMIGHQAIGEQAHRLFRQSQTQHALEGVEITTLFEQRQPSHRPIESVIDVATRSSTGLARHGPKLPVRQVIVKKKLSASQ